MLVVALRFAFRRLILLAEMAAAGFVALAARRGTSARASSKKSATRPAFSSV